MAKKRKKIYLLLAGGTSLTDKEGNVWAVRNKVDVSSWLEQMPELKILADLEPVFICGEDDLVSAKTWENIASEIDKAFLEADGFVIISKIGQLINTALAVNFLLQNYKKSLIFTSSQISGSGFIDKKEVIGRLKSKYGGLGLRANLINALQIADQPLPGSAIVFGSRVISASKAIEDFSDEVNVFKSADNTYWGKVDFGINLKAGLKYCPKDTEIFQNISSKVLIIEDVLGVDWLWDKDIKNYQGLLIKTNPYQSLEKAKQQKILKWKIPTICHNYLFAHKVDGAVSMSNCTRSSALLKLMWYLANAKQAGSFEESMKQNLIGEFYLPR